jgi:hypothetical protein
MSERLVSGDPSGLVEETAWEAISNDRADMSAYIILFQAPDIQRRLGAAEDIHMTDASVYLRRSLEQWNHGVQLGVRSPDLGDFIAGVTRDLRGRLSDARQPLELPPHLAELHRRNWLDAREWQELLSLYGEEAGGESRE